jgi:hypothetical protein
VHVEPDPATEGLLAQPRLDHAEHRPALLVGDEVEGLPHVLGISHLGVDGVGGPERVEAERGGLALVEVEPDAPLGLPAGHDLVGHPGGEGLVQPEVVPPPHRHPVAEPLVGELVGDHLGDPLPHRE